MDGTSQLIDKVFFDPLRHASPSIHLELRSGVPLHHPAKPVRGKTAPNGEGSLMQITTRPERPAREWAAARPALQRIVPLSGRQTKISSACSPAAGGDLPHRPSQLTNSSADDRNRSRNSEMISVLGAADPDLQRCAAELRRATRISAEHGAASRRHPTISR